MRDVLKSDPQGLWLDAGGGRVCEFGDLLTAEEAARGIAVDNSLLDLEQNTLLTRKVQCNLDGPLPFEKESIAAVFSSRTIEHLKTPSVFIQESFRILKDEGRLVVVLPTGRAPFSVIKRILPHSVSRKMVTRFVDIDSNTLCWANLYYRECSPRALCNSIEQAGFVIENVSVSFKQAQHFRTLAPAYWLMQAYDKILETSGISSLAAYVMIQAKKPTQQ